MNRLLLLISIVLVGCGSTQTFIQDKTIKVVPPVIEDSLPTYQIITVDSIVYVQGEKIVNHDTVVAIRYVPKENKVYYKVKPDTVMVTYRDTTRITTKEATPFLSKLGIAGIGFIVAIVVFGAVFVYFKVKP